MKKSTSEPPTTTTVDGSKTTTELDYIKESYKKHGTLRKIFSRKHSEVYAFLVLFVLGIHARTHTSSLHLPYSTVTT